MTVAWEFGSRIPLVIGVPIMGNVSLEWAFMLRNLIIPQNTKFMSSRGVPIDVARERVVDDFLKTGAEWLFFLDSDVYIEPNTIMRMINKKYPVLSGLYYTRIPPIVPLCWKLTPEGKKSIPFNDGDIVSADAGGAGCLLIHKSVFEKIDKPYFQWTLGHKPERMESMCALPGQLVSNTNKLIEDIEIGDSVYNLDGEVDSVVKTFKKDYNGEIIKILPRIIKDTIDVTPEHHVLVYKNVCRVYNNGSKPKWDFSSAEEKWVQAKDITKNDYISMGIPKYLNHDIDNIECKFELRDKLKPYNLPITERTLMLMGKFFGDGWTTGIQDISIGKYDSLIGISFDYHKNKRDKENIDFYKSVISGDLNLKVKEQKRDHATELSFHKVPLVIKLKKWFGDKSYNKRVPSWIFGLPHNKIQAFLKGIWNSDGYINITKNTDECKLWCYGINITTRIGALQICQLLLMEGIRPTMISYDQAKESFGSRRLYRVMVTNDFNKMAEMFGESKRRITKSDVVHEASFIRNNRYWMKIDSIDSYQYDGKVYDLQIKDKQSYLLNGFVSHNSEDFYFFRKIRRAGYRFLVDSSIRCKHQSSTVIDENGQIEYLKG